ncbi:MAG: SdrD B-like domain-containing protein [Ignavibacteriaceae bacterium]
MSKRDTIKQTAKLPLLIILVFFVQSIYGQSITLCSHSPFNDFNNSSNPGKSTNLWLNIHTNLNGELANNGDYILFTGGTLTLTGISCTPQVTNYQVPCGKIIADNTVSSPITSYDTTINTWITKVPLGFSSSDIFICGAIANSSNGFVAGSGKNTQLAGYFYSNISSLSKQWTYGLACYQSAFSYSSICKAGCVNSISGGTPAGTPTTQTNYCVAGGSCGGGSDYCGSYCSSDKYTTCGNYYCSIGDFVWNDANHNGIQNSGEAGLTNVTVKLYTSAGVLASTTTTNSNGKYLFSNLTPGSYYVQFVVPGGYTVSPALQGSDTTVDSNPNSTGKTGTIYLKAGQNNLTIDCGMYPTPPVLGSIGDFVWNDANHNGIQDVGEAGISNVTVKLYTTSGTLVTTTTTNSSGKYLFSNLSAGSYYAQFVVPAGYTVSPALQGKDTTIDSNPNSTGKTGTIYLTAGQNNLTIDCGLYPTPPAVGSIGDFVWNDANHNGIQDAGETGIANVTVNLYTTAGTLVSTTTTNSSGKYLFSNLSAGSYYIQFVIPAGYTVSPALQGSDTTLDSNPNSTGKTGTIYLTAGQNNLTIDCGMYPTPPTLGSIGDFVWNDANHNGIQDAGEAGISNVTVNLYTTSGTLVSTTTTNSSGKYLFSNLSAGSYYVQFVIPTGYTVSPSLQGIDTTIDSNPNSTGKTGTIYLAAGQNNLTIDCGMYPTPPALGSIGDFVWNDANHNGIQDAGETGISNVTVQLYNNSNNSLVATTTTDANGKYLFSNLSAGSYYVQFVIPNGYTVSAALQGSDTTIDSNPNSTGKTGTIYLTSGQNNLTIDCGMYPTPPALGSIGNFVWNDANHNGIQDAGETGISNITVQLYNTGNNSLVATTTTDANGKYLFSNLTAGSYYVQFVIPGGYTVSPALQGNDTTVDSNPNSTGKTGTLYLTAGQNNLTVDCGIYPTPPALGSIGDFVWNDANHNGIQDAGEAGIANVTVNLFTTSGSLISTTTTNSNGKYLFSNLSAGSYYVQFVIPTGYTLSPSLQGSDTTIDSNPNSAGETATIYLTAGQNNLTIDCGMYLTPPVLGSIGDFVWNDANHNGIQDAGEAGLPSVTVELFSYNNNSLVAITTTDANGKYLFSNLSAGSYYVQFVVPNGYTISPAIQGSDTTIDSNPNSTGKTGVIYLTAGQNNLTIDCGMYLLPVNQNADLQIQKSVSNANPSCGDNFSYTIIVTNLGPNSASNVVANDVLPAGIVYQSSNTTIGSFDTTTGVWTIGTLANGAAATLTINVTVDCTKMNSTSFDLGVAKGFNLFVIQDLNQPSCDSQGKVAVGRNATLSNYSIGDKLSSNSGDVLVVGNNLSYSSGAVLNGNVVFGNATNLPQSTVSIAGSLTKATPIDFTAAQSYLQGLSVSLGNYTVNGTTLFQWGGLKLTGTDPYLNVFKVNGSDLSSANDFQIDVPNGSVVVVNVNGANISWSGGLAVTGTAINNVLYNFYQATNLSITGINVRGSILAPDAALVYPSGLITGEVIVNSMTGSGQFNLSPFQGNIPVDTMITNTATVTSATADSIISNNTSSATILVGGTTNNSNGTGTGSSGNGNSGVNTLASWKSVSSFSQGQIVYTLMYDSSSIYAGTTGGKIYKSIDNGTNWTLINSGMNASSIWSLLKTGSSFLAATDNGVYSYNDTTWSLTSLNGKDVHALTANGNTIYAGTWGYGIFKSGSNGTTWNKCNSGLDSTSMVQSLTVNNGIIFAGTIGSGLFKSTDGSNWIKTECAYQSIQSLCSTNSDVYAGTYGDGLYKSVDGGSSFAKVTSLNVSYIYNVMTDLSGKIYVSSLTNGVFVSADNGSTWNTLGMGGFNVSSLMVNAKTSDVYAGTKAGTVYKISGSQTITATTKVTEVPKEFKLSQNYPNPFNPSTMINYSVAKTGLVTIKVYNILGKEITTLVNEVKSAGDYSVQFSAKSGCASGVYFYSMQAGNFVQTKKLVLLK